MEEELIFGLGPFYHAELNRVVFHLVPAGSPPSLPSPPRPEPVPPPMASPLHDSSIVRAGIEQMDLRSSQDAALTALIRPRHTDSGIIPFISAMPNVAPLDSATIKTLSKYASPIVTSFKKNKNTEHAESYQLDPFTLTADKEAHGFIQSEVIPPVAPAPIPQPLSKTEPPKPAAPKASLPPKPKSKLAVQAVVEEPEEVAFDVPPEDESPPPKPVVKKVAPKPAPVPKLPVSQPKAVPTPKPSLALKVLGPPAKAMKPIAIVETEEPALEEGESEGPNIEIEGEETDVGESEPEDAEDLEIAEEDGEDEEEVFTEERKAELKRVEALVRIPYEQRFAGAIADIHEKFDAKQVPKTKEKKKSVQFLDATHENRPIRQINHAGAI